MIMSRIGVKEDNIEPFITDIYNRCKDLGMSPDRIADHLKDLIDFSKLRYLFRKYQVTSSKSKMKKQS
jgi:hypothetical protein